MDLLWSYLLMIIVYVIFWRKWRNEKGLILKTLFYIYICLVIDVTLLPIKLTISFHLPGSSLTSYGNFIPFIDLIKDRPLAMREIILNVVMLIPFGIMYPLIFNKKVLNVVVMTLLFSTMIEFIQLFMAAFLVSSRTFDVTDIITNTLGGLLGFIIYRLIRKLAQRSQSEH